MAFDLEFGCKNLVLLIVSRATADSLSKNDFNKLPEKERLEYVNQLVDLGWVKEQRPANAGSDYVIFAFSDKGRKIYENPVELLSLTDAEQEHISLLRKLDSLKNDDSVAMMPQVLLSLANACLGVGRYDSALMYAIELQRRAEAIKSTYFKAEAELMVGRVDNARGELESSLKSFMEGAVLFRKIGEVAREADCQRSAGGVLFKMGDYKKAMVLFEESKSKCL
jgi:tetratricopeptide (TPR) repeat protein